MLNLRSASPQTLGQPRFEGRREAGPPRCHNTPRAGHEQGDAGVTFLGSFLCTHLLGVPGLQRMLVVVEGLFDGRHLEKKHWRGGSRGSARGERHSPPASTDRPVMSGALQTHPPQRGPRAMAPPHPTRCPVSLQTATEGDAAPCRARAGTHLYCLRPRLENLQESR